MAIITRTSFTGDNGAYGMQYTYDDTTLLVTSIIYWNWTSYGVRFELKNSSTGAVIPDPATGGAVWTIPPHTPASGWPNVVTRDISSFGAHMVPITTKFGTTVLALPVDVISY